MPYRGGVPAATAVAAGDVPIGAVTQSSAQSLIDAGRIKVLALMTKERPAFTPPAWPTLPEQGLDVDAALWVRCSHPRARRRRSSTGWTRRSWACCRTRTCASASIRLGTEAAGISQKAFVDRIKRDAARYLRIIEQTGIKVEH